MTAWENIRQKIQQLKARIADEGETPVRVDLLNALSRELYVYDTDQALSFGLKARQLARVLAYSRGFAESFNSEAYVYRMRGNFRRSLNLSKQALQLFESIDNKKGAAASLNNIAFMYFNLDDIREGLQQALKAWMFSLEEHDEEAESFACLVMGMCYENLDDYPQAIEQHMRAQSICRRLNLLNEEGAATLNLGIVFRKIKEHTKARDHFIEALKIFRETQIRLLEAAALLYLGYSFMDSDDLHDALICFQESLLLQKDLSYTLGQGGCYINIGRVYQKMKQFKKAEENINQSLEQARTFNKKNNEANAKYYLADCYLEQRKTSEAIALLEESLEEAERYASKAVRYKSLMTLSHAYELKNDFKKAFNYYRNAQNIHEELINEESSKKTKGLMILNDAENARRERDFAIREKLRAEQSERFKEQFLANMSHEIRTPMNAIVGLTDLLSRTKLSTIQQKYVSTIQQSSDNLLEIIQDVLDFSKIEAGEVQLESIPFNVHNVMTSVVDTMQVKAEEKNLELKKECNVPVNEEVIGDPLKLKQILMNLVGNAIKFTEKGSVLLRCYLEEENKDEVRLFFSVEDTGIGIPEDRLQDVFKSFVQASSSTMRNYGGTGLGLTISEQLVKMQGGTIAVKSTVNAGSTFSFFIPYKKILEEKTGIEESTSAINHSALSGLNILLVEDNKFNRLVAVDTLKEYIPGVTVMVADNGAMAWQSLQSQKFDLVLLDLQMPEMNGYELLREIRSNQEDTLRTVPVLALTAYATKAERERCLRAGMNDYLAKPFHADDLIEKIKKILARDPVQEFSKE